MCTSILSSLLESVAKAESTGAQFPINKFIATVNTEASAHRLETRFRKHSKRLRVFYGDNVAAMEEADIIMLGCKPYQAQAVLTAEGIRKALNGKLLISVITGKTSEKLESFIYGDVALSSDAEPRCYIRRATPNLAAELRASATVVQVETTALPPHFATAMEWIFLQIGTIHGAAPDLYDVASAMGGTAPSYLSVALDGLLDGAVQQGLKRPEAKKILTQAIIGLAKVLDSGEHPAMLRENTASPRGTTIEGLLSLEEDRVRHAFSKAMIRTTMRSLEISRS